MGSVVAAHEALVRAELESREGLRPRARESAARAARVAEDRFIAARLEAWAAVLNTKPARAAA
jgi:hypothetical protein